MFFDRALTASMAVVAIFLSTVCIGTTTAASVNILEAVLDFSTDGLTMSR